MAANGSPHVHGATLERDHILKEILDQIGDYAERFNTIDYDSFKDDVLKPILAENFNPETQIRGYLKAFQHTTAYKNAYSQIQSPELKQQIDAFLRGTSAKDIIGEKGFHVQAHRSPPVVHHFSLLEELKKLVVGKLKLRTFLQYIFSPKRKHVIKLPKLYEDAAGIKAVEVGIFAANTTCR